MSLFKGENHQLNSVQKEPENCNRKKKIVEMKLAATDTNSYCF